MSRCIDDVDLDILVKNCCILGKNCDTTFTFDIIGVHDSFLYNLIGSENTALFQKLIYQSCFTMVNVSDDGNVSCIFSLYIHINPSF